MTDGGPGSPVDARNHVAAEVTGLVVQAGVINGGVQLDATPPPPPTPRQLPPSTRWFTGRRRELDALTAAWQQATGAPVVLIVGPGGMGKSSLALHWARQHVDLFPDGQLYVDLGGHAPGGGQGPAVRAILDALGVDPRSIPVEFDAQVGRYRSLVAGKRMLIVLDDARDTAQVTALLPGGGTCSVLVTSRDRLDGVHSALGACRVPLGELNRLDAAELVALRLGGARADAEPAALAELLDHCAGLPLALAVVAARLAGHPAFPLAAVAAELRDATTRLTALDTGDPTTTLTSVLALSYHALSPATADCFTLLGLVAGPDVGLGAVAALAGVAPAVARGRMRELERASLVDEHEPDRWRMHDLVRLYAATLAREQDADRWRAALRRLVAHYVRTAYAGDRVLDPHRVPLAPAEPGPQWSRAAVLAWFDAEHRALRDAQRVAAELGWHDAVWQLAWVSHTYRWQRGHVRDQVDGWRAALAAAGRSGDGAALATAHRLLGAACARTGALDEAFRHLHGALELVRGRDDPAEQGHVCRALARAWERRGDGHRALADAERALALYRQARSPRDEADALDLVGRYEAALGRCDDARRHCAAALDLYRTLADPDGEATTLDSLGYVAQRAGRPAEAVDHYALALALFQGRNTYHEADTLTRLGEVNAVLGEHAAARLAWTRAARLFAAQRRDADEARVRRLLGEERP